MGPGGLWTTSAPRSPGRLPSRFGDPRIRGRAGPRAPRRPPPRRRPGRPNLHRPRSRPSPGPAGARPPGTGAGSGLDLLAVFGPAGVEGARAVEAAVGVG